MGELGEVLALVHSARHRFDTLRATLRSGRANADDEDERRESTARVWFERPRRFRIEREPAQYAFALEIVDGDTHWQYRPENGTVITAAPTFLPLRELIDPSSLVADRLRPEGRAVVAGRLAILVHVVREMFGDRNELRMAIDAERGVVLRIATAEEEVAHWEVVEIAFDETFPDDTFVYVAPAPDPERPRIDPELYRERAVDLEGAARLASFAVLQLDLPTDWEVSGTYAPQRPWPGRGSPPEHWRDRLQLIYRLDDASHVLTLLEWPACGELPGDDDWSERKYAGRTVWMSGANDYDRQVVVEVDSTVVTLRSATLTPDQLLQATAKLVRI
jgi:outer membrane lipoprotein-sorting protein